MFPVLACLQNVLDSRGGRVSTRRPAGATPPHSCFSCCFGSCDRNSYEGGGSGGGQRPVSVRGRRLTSDFTPLSVVLWP